MKNIAAASRVKVSADGHGVVSHAGMGMLRELADRTGLSAQVTAALADTYRGPWVYAPGEVFADLAAAVADGADCIDGVGQLCGDREHVFGAKASTTTMWRLVDERIDAAHLPGVRAARAAARAAAWERRSRPHRWVAAHRHRRHPGHRPFRQQGTGARRPGRRPSVITRCWRFWTARRSPAVKPWPGCCAPAAPAPTPPLTTSPSWSRRWRRCRRGGGPTPTIATTPMSRQVLVRCDTAGATHDFADGLPHRGVGFSFGYPVDARVQDAVDTLNLGECWYPAIDTDGGIRDGAWVAEATDLVNLSSWPAGTRLILRKERPHPGAQLRFTDADGMRVTAFITDTAPGVVAGQVAGLELRHRQHARVEDRIRELKATGLRNLPCHAFDANAAWLEIVLAAADLVTWADSSDSPATPAWPAPRSPPSATESCTSPPASPAAPAEPDYASTPPGGGPQPSRPPGNASAPPSVDRQPI